MKQKMVCIACGEEVGEDMTFCPYCGSEEFKMIEDRSSEAFNNPNPIDNMPSDNAFDNSGSYDVYNASYNQTEKIQGYNDMGGMYGSTNVQQTFNDVNMGMQANASMPQNNGLGLTTTHKILIAVAAVVMVVIVAVVGINVSKGNKQSKTSTKKTVNAEAKKKIKKLENNIKIGSLSGFAKGEDKPADTGLSGTTGSSSDIGGGKSDIVTEPPVETEPNTAVAQFSAGSVDNNVYTNEWLGIKVVAPVGYIEEADDTEDDVYTQSGFNFQNPNTASTFMCYFVDATSQPAATTSMLLDEIIVGMTEVNNYEKIENSTQTLQGVEYVYEHGKSNVEGYPIYISNYVGKYENRLIIFSIINTMGTSEDNKSMINSIQGL